MRIVWHHGCVPDHEGLCLLSCLLDEIKNGLESLTSDLQSLVAVPAAEGHPVGESAVLIVPLPPFASLQRQISLFHKELWQRGGGIHESIHFISALLEKRACLELPRGHSRGYGRIIAGDSVLVWVLARDD